MPDYSQGTPEPQAALDRITIIENHEPLVDIRDIPHLTFHREHRVNPFLRATVAAMLREAAANIPKPYHLEVFSALRSLEHQQAIWDSHYHRHRDAHPTWPEHQLRRAVNRYVAPTDHTAPPGHTTGGAVDVILRNGEDYVDLVPPHIEDWSMSHTWSTKVTPEVRAIRNLLYTTMTQAGFSNCRDEYWHYSWGDSGWAVRTGASSCCYGAVPVPVWE